MDFGGIVLARTVSHFYVAFMTFAALFQKGFPLFLSLAFIAPAFAQADAEELARLRAELGELREANVAFLKQIADLNRKIERLQGDLRDANERSIIKLGDFVTREELKRISDRIGDVDQKREQDRKVILDAFDTLEKNLLKRERSAPVRPKEREPEKGRAEDTVFEGEVIEHKVQETDQTLGHILQNYNEALKKRGLRPIGISDIRKANPKLNPNRIFTGQTILLPVPEKD